MHRTKTWKIVSRLRLGHQQCRCCNRIRSTRHLSIILLCNGLKTTQYLLHALSFPSLLPVRDLILRVPAFLSVNSSLLRFPCMLHLNTIPALHQTQSWQAEVPSYASGTWISSSPEYVDSLVHVPMVSSKWTFALGVLLFLPGAIDRGYRVNLMLLPYD